MRSCACVGACAWVHVRACKIVEYLSIFGVFVYFLLLEATLCAFDSNQDSNQDSLERKKSLGFLESEVECFLMPPHMYTSWDIKKKPKEIRGVANEQEHAAGERIWREDCV